MTLTTVELPILDRFISANAPEKPEAESQNQPALFARHLLTAVPFRSATLIIRIMSSHMRRLMLDLFSSTEPATAVTWLRNIFPTFPSLACSQFLESWLSPSPYTLGPKGTIEVLSLGVRDSEYRAQRVGLTSSAPMWNQRESGC